MMLKMIFWDLCFCALFVFFNYYNLEKKDISEVNI